jgi:hypothetical protein
MVHIQTWKLNSILSLLIFLHRKLSQLLFCSTAARTVQMNFLLNLHQLFPVFPVVLVEITDFKITHPFSKNVIMVLKTALSQIAVVQIVAFQLVVTVFKIQEKNVIALVRPAAELIANALFVVTENSIPLPPSLSNVTMEIP